jgi:hypothetical protein
LRAGRIGNRRHPVHGRFEIRRRARHPGKESPARKRHCDGHFSAHAARRRGEAPRAVLKIIEILARLPRSAAEPPEGGRKQI